MLTMRLSSRALLFCLAATVFFTLLQQWRSTRQQSLKISEDGHPLGCDRKRRHPIDTLLENAEPAWWKVVSKQTNTLQDSASVYRLRRGRHPPPGFDAWYNNAKAQNAVIVEDFFDQIYQQIEPFWGLKPQQIRASVVEWPEIVTIRNGRVQDVPNDYYRTKIWVKMLSKISRHLPDMDIPLNHLDEARVVAPYHVIEKALIVAKQQLETISNTPDGQFFSNLADMSLEKNVKASQSSVVWSKDKNELHKAVRDSCHPRSALRAKPLPWYGKAPYKENEIMDKYVENTTTAKDICRYPQLANLHGDLVEPATVDFTTTLIPVFTGSKLPVYNDIIIPEPSYYSDDEMYTGKTFWGDWSSYYKWTSKVHGLVWRGGSTGGGAHDDNWKYFHRHRMISHLNGTESDVQLIGDRPRDLNDWLPSVTDAAFTRLYCDDAKNADNCPSMSSHFELGKPIKMASQFQWKYLPDTDGNSISERFRAFLLSNSAPIKATIFDDWQDTRLCAWLHYIPMQLSYDDLYDIMMYFLGFDKTCAHDEAGNLIAQTGQQWSQKVLRKEDMEIYLHRVLLEYARVVHDDRDRLGYVSDR